MDPFNQYIFETFVTRNRNPERQTMNTSNDTPRPLYRIAQDIRAHWPRPYFGAVPYIEALAQVDHITDHYGNDDAQGLVLYFLANAGTWRGDDARRIKAELKAMAGLKGGK
jgi:hypothetical protein